MRVVITGLGCISPVGNNVPDFWNNILNGKNGIGFITKFDASDCKAKLAAEVKGYDPLSIMDFNDIKKIDLFAQYALYAAREAVEDSEIIGKVDKYRFGVYIGSGIGGLSTIVNENNKLNEGGPNKVSAFCVTMMISNIASARVAINYNAMGCNLPIVTACATGTNSIGEAYRAIKDGYADAIICGGTEATINKLAVTSFTNCRALTPVDDINNASIPFDKRRKGFVIGEGAAVVILESLDNALHRNAKIYGEIVGYSNTCDAFHITAPSEDGMGATRAIEEALKQANYRESDKVYFNAHGTSTQLNDKIETLAIKNALKDKAYDCMVSSTKSMTGHMMAAAGAIEVIASVLAVRDNVAPPTINYKEKDTDCDLDYVPHNARYTNIDLAVSNSFGFGGHNACIAIRKYSK